MTNSVTWTLQHHHELAPATLYQLLKIRQEVFVVEQDCAYLDADGLDEHAHHVIGWRASVENPQHIVAYARLLPPGLKYDEAAIGRVLTDLAVRGTGLGDTLMRQAIAGVEQHFPGHAIRISAQAHLDHFYHRLGFETVSDPYDEDGIPHIEMLRPR